MIISINLNFGYKEVIQNCSSILYESNSRLYSTRFILIYPAFSEQFLPLSLISYHES